MDTDGQRRLGDFHAGRPATVYSLRLVPGGLNASNQAAAGVVTPVSLRVDGADPGQLPVVTAQESTNDGKTWRTVRVRMRGDRYLLSVRNPAQPGFVSLRLLAKGSSGTWEKLTVIHAYGVR